MKGLFSCGSLRQMWSFQFLLGKVSFNWAAKIRQGGLCNKELVLGVEGQLCWGEENRIC